MNIQQYLEQLSKRYKAGNSTEHTFRGDLQTLLESLAKNVMVTNEPSRIACGAPDYILTKAGIPIGYIEAKDIGIDLGSKTLKAQLDRYKASLENLIVTDYLDFHLFIEGEFKTAVKIAELRGGQIIALPEQFERFTDLIKDFVAHQGQTIKSSKKLAEMMAGKARMLASVIESALLADETEQKNRAYESANNTLRDQLAAFQTILIHDIKPKEFADIYAQTIAYGMFAARLHDPTLETFTRQEAAELIPKTNPFLRKLFQYIAGYDLDTRIAWIVDGLADLFRATDVAALLKNFGKATQTQDPIIHFYETFLSEYDPKLRKSRGVWYTPEPVVKFIVRAVDDILKTEFGLSEGLTDTSKTKIKVRIQDHDKRNKKGFKEVEQEVHKVQILDPATGTGTFLAEVIKHIYQKFDGQQGIWSKYVDQHLIPRLNGFELLMASYAMAHLKLDLLLTETGYKSSIDQRFRIYLTNSLEESHPDTGTLFSNWLSAEANEANHIKRDTPVMCVIGNPPYAVSSANRGDWIQNLILDYKKGLNERKLNLDDDYIKFIRYGQHFIEKNGSGILAYISNNSFIDGITHRQMRKSLLTTFDQIYILDLHGNAKRKETAPDGSADINVFDIMAGVSINIFVKKGRNKKSELSHLNHFELYGKREEKYNALLKKGFFSFQWNSLECLPPNYFFVPKNLELSSNYGSWIGLSTLFKVFSTGIESKCDEITMHFDKQQIAKVIADFQSKGADELKKQFHRKDSEGWNYHNAKEDLIKNVFQIEPVSYRPFDVRYTAYSGFSGGFLGRPRSEMNNNLLQENLAISSTRSRRNDASCYFVSQHITDKSIASSLDNNYIFPLYVYSKNTQKGMYEALKRQPNLNPSIIKEISDKLDLTFTSEKESTKATFSPIDILDYIYAVLHSPSYREKYKEFLKIDFPRVPYPKDQATFWSLVKLGGELRQIHLLESPVVSKFITGYPEDGTNVVEKPVYKDGKVYINQTQYFSNVPRTAWEFYIGGYQPAQKWLKDRKGRELSFEDIQHYQKIIVALTETDRLMKEVDKVGVV